MNDNFTRGYGRADFTKTDIIGLFSRYTQEFDYIAKYLNDLNIRGFCVAINKNDGYVYFNLSGKKERWVQYTKLGYTKDVEFESCLNAVLVDGDLGYLQYGPKGYISFGPNLPIRHIGQNLIETLSEYPDSPDIFGNIERDWFYYVQLYE